MIDDLEPGPDPREVPSRRSRRPDPPARVPNILRSFNEGKEFSIRRATLPEALEVESELKAAQYHVKRWLNPDVRTSMYIMSFWTDASGAEHGARSRDEIPAGAKGYYKVVFKSHPRNKQGMATMDPELAKELRRKAVDARIAKQQATPPRGRNVQRRAAG